MKKIFLGFCILVFSASNAFSQKAVKIKEEPPVYQYNDTENLVFLVRDAAALVQKEGEFIFPEFKKENSRWRHGDTYIFVVDTEGNMVLHPDSALEGQNEIELKDVNNKLIIRGIINAASGKNKEGWYHYQWPEPGSILPLWKSAFVKQVTAPSGRKYVVCSGLYNMRMEKEFIVSLVDLAVALIEKEGRDAFPKIRDKAGQFIFLDTYVFVDSPDGTELVNGAFPNIEGRNLMDYRDIHGEYLVREYINLALTRGSGWIDYLWPKPGQSAPSKRHAYVRKAQHGKEIFIVGAGAYLE